MHHHTCLNMTTSSRTWCQPWGSLSTRGRMALVLGKRDRRVLVLGKRDRTVLVLGRRGRRDRLGMKVRDKRGKKGMAPLGMQSIACHTL